MSMVQHIIDEIYEITQEEINTIHLEIHRITNRDIEGIDGEEMTTIERKEYNKTKKEIQKSEPY